MTDIAFHFNMPDKLQYACRLLRKGVNSGAKLTVAGPASLLLELDARLWSFSALDFVPHAFSDMSVQLSRRSPVLLSEFPDQGVCHPWLVNVGPAVPEGYEQFERVIELVDQSDEDRYSGRLRWKHYSSKGHTVDRFDVAQGAGA